MSIMKFKFFIPIASFFLVGILGTWLFFSGFFPIKENVSRTVSDTANQTQKSTRQDFDRTVPQPVIKVEELIHPDASSAVSFPSTKVSERVSGVVPDLPADPDTPGWTQTSGPLGGTVIRMISYKDTLWASLYSGGIYELQRDGSWKQIAIGHGIPENRASDIILDSNNMNIAYVPEMIACGAKTMNGGLSWTGLCGTMLRDIQADNFSTHTLALDPDDSQVLYVPGNTHDNTSMLLMSVDGGTHWTKRFVFNKHFDFNHVFFFDSKMYLATVQDGVFVSSDKGKSWQPLNAGLKNLTTARFINFKRGLYLLGARLQFNVREMGELYRLAADGLSWEAVRGLDNVTGIGTNGETFFAGTQDNGLWTSGDGIAFSQKKSLGLPSGWIGEIVSLNSKIYVGIGGDGVYVSSDNGARFAESNIGMSSVATREVYVNPKNENEIYVGTWDRLGFYWSKNAGKTYTRVATDYNVLTLRPDPNDFSRVYLGGEQFYVGSVSKEGITFTEKVKPGSSSAVMKSIAIDPTDFRHILAGIATEAKESPPGEGLWESRDQGGTWTRAKGIGNFAVYSILFHPTNSRIVYASALGGGVFKSTDGGTHFTTLGGDSLKYTYRLAMSSGDPDILVASSNLFFGQLSNADQYSGKYGGIFQTYDGGATWKEVTLGIRNYDGGAKPKDFLGWLYNFGHMPNYEMVLINPKDHKHLIVGHHGENVVVTRDGGVTWEKQGAEQMVAGGIHNYAYCLGSSSGFDKIYACTCGRGLFRGLVNDRGVISWSFAGTAYAKDLPSNVEPHTAEEARSIILSGAYNHQH